MVGRGGWGVRAVRRALSTSTAAPDRRGGGGMRDWSVPAASSGPATAPGTLQYPTPRADHPAVGDRKRVRFTSSRAGAPPATAPFAPYGKTAATTWPARPGANATRPRASSPGPRSNAHPRIVGSVEVAASVGAGNRNPEPPGAGRPIASETAAATVVTFACAKSSSNGTVAGPGDARTAPTSGGRAGRSSRGSARRPSR